MQWAAAAAAVYSGKEERKGRKQQQQQQQKLQGRRPTQCQPHTDGMLRLLLVAVSVLRH